MDDMLLCILDEPDQIHILLGEMAIVHSNSALPACLSDCFLGNRSLKTTYVVSFPGIGNLRNIEPSEYRAVTQVTRSFRFVAVSLCEFSAVSYRLQLAVNYA